MQKDSPNFFDDVFEVVKLIPKGRVTTYGAIARYLGSAKGSRMVGYALNKAMHSADVPAHRVVNRIGVLTGKANFIHPNLMQELLEAEGVIVLENQVKDFNQLFWDPLVELAC